jgi:hypothetical protein
MRRDFWDWVVVVVVPLGAAIGALALLVAWIALRRGRTLITFHDEVCETPENDPSQVDAGVTVSVSSSGFWTQKTFAPTFRRGRWRRRIHGLRDVSLDHFPTWCAGSWEGRVRWRFYPPGARKIRMKLKVRLWPHGRRTFRTTLKLPPRFWKP